MADTVPGASAVAVRTFEVQVRLAELGPGPHALKEISAHCAMDDATVSRVLAAGIYKRIFRRTARGMYELARPLSELAYALPHGPPREDAAAALQELRAATDGGLALLYLKAPGLVTARQCSEMAVGDSDLTELGMSARDVLAVTRSLRTGASGRVILAYLPPALQAQVLDEPVPDEAGPGVIRDRDALAASLDTIREVGYGLGHQECMAGWNSIAAPVFDGDSIVASVLLLRPALQMQRAPASYIRATEKAAAALSST